ncbi:MAG: DUF2007 domain-containing protein [Minwuia sp.]|uniref:putative signal transducing protein n=1 Tax=Minwuia sp. TaxID=2493630 RepID=UPI003A8ACF60
MKELFRSNDPVEISFAEAVLKAEGIEPLVLDQHMSVLEGSLGILPKRLAVADDDEAAARALLQDAGLL